MNEQTASAFINSLVKNLQVLCHSNVEFNQNIEVIGHLYLNIDSSKKINYIVNEKVCKNDNSSTMFVSNSFHAEDNKQKKQNEKQSAPEQQTDTTKDMYPAQSVRDYSGKNSVEFGSGRTDFSLQGGERVHKQYQNRHKRSLSIDESHFNAKLAKRDSVYNPHNQNMFSPPSSHGTGSVSVKSEKSSIDLSLVKQEPGTRNNELSSPCLYSSTNKPYNNNHSSNLHQRSNSSSSLHQQNSPKGNNHDTSQILQSSDFSSMMENSEIYPVGMVQNTALHNVLPSISTLTCSKYNQSATSSASSILSAGQVLPSRQKGQRTDLKLDDKINLIKAAMSPNKPKQSVLAAQFGVSQPTISYILQRKDQYLAEYREYHNRMNMPSFSLENLDAAFDFDTL